MFESLLTNDCTELQKTTASLFMRQYKELMAKGKRSMATQTFKDGTSDGARILAELNNKLEKVSKDFKKKEIDFDEL